VPKPFLAYFHKSLFDPSVTDLYRLGSKVTTVGELQFTVAFGGGRTFSRLRRLFTIIDPRIAKRINGNTRSLLSFPWSGIDVMPNNCKKFATAR